MDRRIQKSRAAFRRALEELSAEKPFEKITVSEICARADMSRPAFYDNYRDKQALLHDVMLRSLEGFAWASVLRGGAARCPRQRGAAPQHRGEERGRRADGGA